MKRKSFKLLLLVNVILFLLCNCTPVGNSSMTTVTPAMPSSSIINVTPISTTICELPTDPALVSDWDYEKYQAFLEAGTAECWTTAMTQLEMNMCAAQKAQESEAMLKQFLEEYLSVLDDEPCRLLVEVQLIWEDYKQRDCQRVFESYNSGTIAPMNRNLCWNMHNRHRLESLVSECRAG